MARCLRRWHLYQRYLVPARRKLERISREKDWHAFPGAFDHANLTALLAALEDILDIYVAYGVAAALRRMNFAEVLLRADASRRPTLDQMFPSHPGAIPFAGTAVPDREASAAYANYFEWYIDCVRIAQRVTVDVGTVAIPIRARWQSAAASTADTTARVGG